MFTFILLTIGFLLGNNFSESVINAFDFAQYWLWFAAGIVTIIALFVITITTVFGASAAIESRLGKVGTALAASAGTFIGILISLFAIVRTYALLWLSYDIIENVPIDATMFSNLPVNTQYEIYAFGIILLIGMIFSPSYSSK